MILDARKIYGAKCILFSLDTNCARQGPLVFSELSPVRKAGSKCRPYSTCFRQNDTDAATSSYGESLHPGLPMKLFESRIKNMLYFSVFRKQLCRKGRNATCISFENAVLCADASIAMMGWKLYFHCHLMMQILAGRRQTFVLRLFLTDNRKQAIPPWRVVIQLVSMHMTLRISCVSLLFNRKQGTSAGIQIYA